MPQRVRVVTDSTAAMSPELVARHAITVVPLQVTAGSKVGAEGIDVTPADVLAALSERHVHVTTSQPAPAAFAQAYGKDAGGQGLEPAVVSVHMSSALSGTCAAATAAAVTAAADGIDVRVVDSRSTAMGLGFAAIAAACAAVEGRDVEGVVAAAHAAASRTSLLFYVDTLEFLRRGGRIGAASALVGTALAVKPLLRLVDGQIAVVDKVRTESRALARLKDLAVRAAGDGAVDLAVHHLGEPARAAALAEELRERLPRLGELYVTEVSAVVAAHTGPGVLGVTVIER